MNGTLSRCDSAEYVQDGEIGVACVDGSMDEGRDDPSSIVHARASGLQLGGSPVPVPARETQHQQVVVRAIVKLLGLEVSDLEALQRGGSRALEKLVRSYHYWATDYNGGNGICPYDHPKKGFFRMTPDAQAYLHSGASKEIHREHVVPVRVLVAELIRLRRSQTTVGVPDVEAVMALNEIVIVTKAQAKKLDASHRDRMPDWWIWGNDRLARLTECLGDSTLVGDRLIGPE